MANIFTIFTDELKRIFHDCGILVFVVIAPLLYPILYAYTYTNEVVRNVPCAVVDESSCALSRDFIRKLDATPNIEIVAVCHSMDEATEQLRCRQAFGIVYIPKSMSDDIACGRQAHVGYYSDMSSMMYYKTMLAGINNVSLKMGRDIRIQRHLGHSTSRQEAIMKMPIKYDYTPLFNPQGGICKLSHSSCPHAHHTANDASRNGYADGRYERKIWANHSMPTLWCGALCRWQSSRLLCHIPAHGRIYVHIRHPHLPSYPPGRLLDFHCLCYSLHPVLHLFLHVLLIPSSSP